MAKVLKEKIQTVTELAPGIYKMTIESEYAAQNAKPGQFVNIKCSEGINALLRRPVSICDIDRSKGTFDMVFQVKGTGTQLLSQKQPGSELDIIAPLGKPFDTSEEYRKIAVVGGGIGIFPLLALLKEMRHAEKDTFLGFRSKDFAVLKSEFENSSNKLHISSDDGTIGSQGLITELLYKALVKESYDIIYTCGPGPMIKRVAELAAQFNVKCQVSMEQRMGCGIGACLVCACKTRLGDEWEYSHVCKDGPVFWADEVIFE